MGINTTFALLCGTTNSFCTKWESAFAPTTLLLPVPLYPLCRLVTRLVSFFSRISALDDGPARPIPAVSKGASFWQSLVANAELFFRAFVLCLFQCCMCCIGSISNAGVTSADILNVAFINQEKENFEH